MLIELNASLRRGRRCATLLATVMLSLAVLSAHGAVAGGHMASPAGGHAATSDGHAMGDATSDAAAGAREPGGAPMAMCLAIVQTAGLALGALALARALAALLALGSVPRWPTLPRVLTPRVALAARARPPDLSVLQVFRR